MEQITFNYWHGLMIMISDVYNIMISSIRLFFGWRRVQVYTYRIVVYFTRTIVLIVASDTMPDLSSVAAMECDEVTILDAAGLEARGAGGAA